MANYTKKPPHEWDEYDKAGFTLEEKEAFIAAGLDAMTALNLTHWATGYIYTVKDRNRIKNDSVTR